MATTALSWEEIVERGKQHNKTVICEVEKRGQKKYFKVKCDICGHEASKTICKLNECKNCCIVSNRSSTEDFIKKAEKIHRDKYNYDLVEYVTCKTKVKIFCNNCENIFEQIPSSHLRGSGCLLCGIDIRNKKITLSEKEFLFKSKNIHGDKFNYDKMVFLNTKSKIKIFCNSCKNTFEQIPSSHLSGSGCRFCAYILLHHKFRLSKNDFISKAILKHGNKYNYDLVEYINNETKVKIKCNTCNTAFQQQASSHLEGHGCSKCNESKGEVKVAKYLSEKSISFIPQKIFKTLKDKSYLKSDFYLTSDNLLIEYDGEGHYFPCFGSTPEEKQKNFEDCQRRDKIKNEWAKANNIPLLRIPYWDFDRIEELIEAFILQHTKKKETKQLVLEM
jgi:hypothetical protein